MESLYGGLLGDAYVNSESSFVPDGPFFLMVHRRLWTAIPVPGTI